MITQFIGSVLDDLFLRRQNAKLKAQLAEALCDIERVHKPLYERRTKQRDEARARVTELEAQRDAAMARVSCPCTCGASAEGVKP